LWNCALALALQLELAQEERFVLRRHVTEKLRMFQDRLLAWKAGDAISLSSACQGSSG
jgi:hypothetical protein